MAYRFKCPTCSDWHEGLPDVVYDEPYHTKDIAEKERPKRVFLTSNLCVLDNKFFFIRCMLFLKIRGSDEQFAFGVWSSLSKDNFLRCQDDYDNDMSQWEPMFGYLGNRLPHYPDTLALKLSVQPQIPGMRPVATLEPTDHPLAVDQRDGVSPEKLLEIAGPFLPH